MKIEHFDYDEIFYTDKNEAYNISAMLRSIYDVYGRMPVVGIPLDRGVYNNVMLERGVEQHRVNVMPKSAVDTLGLAWYGDPVENDIEFNMIDGHHRLAKAWEIGRAFFFVWAVTKDFANRHRLSELEELAERSGRSHVLLDSKTNLKGKDPT